jgi:hypothetical protein
VADFASVGEMLKFLRRRALGEPAAMLADRAADAPATVGGTGPRGVVDLTTATQNRRGGHRAHCCE